MSPFILALALAGAPAYAADGAAPDIPVSTSSSKSADLAPPPAALKPVPASSQKRLDAIRGRLEQRTQGGLEQRADNLDAMYQGSAAGAVSARIMVDDGVGGLRAPLSEPPRGAAPKTDLEPLIKAFDHYQETKDMRKLLASKGIQVKMEAIPDASVLLGITSLGGTAAYYDNVLDQITLNSGYAKADVTSILPTFYHESGHAQWHHLGLEDMVIENELHSWSMANHLNYEIFKDPAFQKQFAESTKGFEKPLAGLEEQRKREDARQAAFREAGLFAKATLWLPDQWARVKEWLASSEKFEIRKHIEENPELFYGTVGEAKNYAEYCKGQTEFFRGIRENYKMKEDGQNDIPGMRERLTKELEASRRPREQKPFQVKGKGFYVLALPGRRSAMYFRERGMRVSIVESDRTAQVGAGPGRPLTVRLAKTPEARERALIYEDSFSPSDGVLLLFERDEQHMISMENVWQDLDILFIGGDQKLNEFFSDVPKDTRHARMEKDVHEAMAKLDRTEAFWKEWREQDLKWRKDHPDYCSDPSVRKVLDWQARFDKAMLQ